LASWLFGFLAFWLFGFLAFWLFGFLAFWTNILDSVTVFATVYKKIESFGHTVGLFTKLWSA
jgi:hypothetical protein